MTTTRNPKNGPFQGLDDGLKLTYWNAGGLTPAKFLEIKHLVLTFDADIFIIVEAGACTENLMFYQIPGYSLVTLKRARPVASGILAGVKNAISTKHSLLHEMTNEDKSEIILFKIWKHQRPYKVYGVYNPPLNKPSLHTNIPSISPKTIIIGDFNAPSHRWGYNRRTTVGKSIEDFIDENHLHVLDSDPTFLSFAGSLTRPDLAMLHPDLVNRTSLELSDPVGGCGHRVVNITVTQTQRPGTSKRRPRWNFKKANWTKFKQLTNAHVTEDLIVGCPDKSNKAVVAAIIKCAQSSVPRGQVRKHRPFWSTKLTDLKRKRNKARKTAENIKSIENCVKLRKAQAELQREIIQSKRQTYKTFVSKLDYRRDGLKAHRYLSSLNNQQVTHPAEPIVYLGKPMHDPKAAANALCHHYTSVSKLYPPKHQSKNLSKTYYTTCLSEKDNDVMNRNFTLAELKIAISSLKPGKSAGPDNIFPEFLSHLGNMALETFLKLANLTLNNTVPDLWRKAEIIPILKKGKPSSEVKSFRPISLTSCCCKLTERMVVNRLTKFLEKSGFFSNEQAAFRKHRGTMDQVVTFVQAVKDGFHRKMSTAAVFIDFTAAYDRVWRKLLLHKLQLIGITGKLFKWLKSFLAQRQIRVRYRDTTSIFKQQRNGLPQGAVASCILFNIMINDLLMAVKQIPGVSALLFADDLVIWAASGSPLNLENVLNQALEKVVEWANCNQMVISEEKTVFSLFTLSTKPPVLTIKLKNTVLSHVDHPRYLGITFDRKLNFGKHLEETANKANNRSRLLKRLTATTWGATQDVLTTTYRTYIRPTMEYGGEVTNLASNQNLKKLDIIQNNNLRLITGGAKSTPISAMEIQTGLEPLEVRRDKCLLKFWEKNRRTNKTIWDTYKTATPRLLSQTTPINKALQLYQKYNLQQTDPAPLISYNQVFDNLPSKFLSLAHHASPKSQSLDIELRQATLMTINERFPEDSWLHVYTDGSSNPVSGETGAGYYSKLFQGAVAVGLHSSNFDGEVMAIREAALQVIKLPPQQVVFLVDSQSAIIAVCSNKSTDCKLTASCREKLQNCHDAGFNIVLQWIPSHVGTSGNERADDLAKNGCLLPQPHNKASLSSANSRIHSAVKIHIDRILKDAAAGKAWQDLCTRPISRTLPRSISVAVFRLSTGHDYLQAHLHRIGLANSDQCPLCAAARMDGEHLYTCPALNENEEDPLIQRSKLYWSARRQMAEMPRTGVG